MEICYISLAYARLAPAESHYRKYSFLHKGLNMQDFSEEELLEAQRQQLRSEAAKKKIDNRRFFENLIWGGFFLLAIAVWVFVENLIMDTLTPDILKTKTDNEFSFLKIPGFSFFNYLQDRQRYMAEIILLVVILVVLLVVALCIANKIIKGMENKVTLKQEIPAEPTRTDYYNISQYEETQQRQGE
jgi:flagellar biosynthesis/type III secretory pathway M-ring protein FliF/YscJ